MNTIKKNTLAISLVLASLVLFQSCRIYNSEHVTIDNAVKEKTRVKIKTNDGQILKYKLIIADSNQYYGLNKKRGKMERSLLSIQTIEYVRLHNKTASTVFSILGSVFLLGAIVAAAASVSISNAVQGR